MKAESAEGTAFLRLKPCPTKVGTRYTSPIFAQRAQEYIARLMDPLKLCPEWDALQVTAPTQYSAKENVQSVQLPVRVRQTALTRDQVRQLWKQMLSRLQSF